MSAPYPWIADDLWAHLQRNANDADRARSPIADVIVTAVTSAEQSKAPVAAPSAEPSLPPQGPEREQLERLHGMRGAGHIDGVEWPLCCQRLAVLSFHHGAGATLDAMIERGQLDNALVGQADPAQRTQWSATLQAMRARRHSGEGISLFRCGACDRVYGSWAIA